MARLADIESAAPQARADHGPSGRRCYLSLVFSDLCDSTALSSGLEAEDYAEILGRLRQEVHAVIERYGGTVVRIQGDGTLAIFGYPDPREGDGRRATEAALDLHEAVRRMTSESDSSRWPALRLHTGIHSGLVLVQQGDVTLGRYELLGNVPNVAARLCDAARRDEILVSEDTLGPERHFFDAGSRRMLTLAGRSEPLATYLISGRAAIRTRFEARTLRGLSPFIGRQSQLAELLSRLDAVRSGAVRQIALCGPAGVGKTRLAQAFLEAAGRQGFGVHRGYCENHLSAEPLQPLLQMLRGHLGLSHDMTADEASRALRARVAPPVADAHGPELLRMLSFGESAAAPRRLAQDGAVSALSAVFDHMLRERPLVLFVDDWQWADAATVQAMSAIAGVPGRSLLVLMATREFAAGDATMKGVDLLEVTPFSHDESLRSISDLLPRVDPFVAAEIARYSGGNALFIEELCHSAAHDEMDRRVARLHGGAAWLNVLVESRVARLPHIQAEVVRTAAVIGNVVPTWLLQELTGFGADHPLLRELAEHDFLFPGESPGTLRFKHGITRDVIHDSVGLHARRAMHLKIAEALRRQKTDAQDEALEALAYHYGAGGRSLDAAHYAELAGDKAVSVSALDRAKAQYRAALAGLDAAGPAELLRSRWLAIAHKLGLVCVFDASRADLAVFRRAVELAVEGGDAGALARTRYWLGYISYALGDLRESIAHCEAALDGSRGGSNDALTVQIRATLGQAKTAAADYDDAMPLLEEAIAIKRKHRSGSKPTVGLAYSLVCKAWVLGDRGDFSVAHECLDEAMDSVRGITHEIVASVQGWRAALLMWQGRWQEALQAGSESTDVAERTRSLFQFCMGRAMTGYAQWKLTGQPQALAQLEQATGWLDPQEGGLFKSLNHGWLADGLVEQGENGMARLHAARALRRGRKGDLIGVAMAWRSMAVLAAREGDRRRSWYCIDRAMQVAQSRQSAHEVAVTRLCAASLHRDEGDDRQLMALLEPAMAAFEEMDMQWHLAVARQLIAR